MACFHFAHPRLIVFATLNSCPLFCLIIAPGYWNLTSCTLHYFEFLQPYLLHPQNLLNLYSVFALLVWSPFDSEAILHSSSISSACFLCLLISHCLQTSYTVELHLGYLQVSCLEWRRINNDLKHTLGVVIHWTSCFPIVLTLITSMSFVFCIILTRPLGFFPSSMYAKLTVPTPLHRPSLNQCKLHVNLSS